MLIRNAPGIRSSEITPKDVYMNRRRFLATATLIGGGLALNARAATYGGLARSPLTAVDPMCSTAAAWVPRVSVI